MKHLALALALVVSQVAGASALVKGLEAEQRYQQLEDLQARQPKEVTSYTLQYFGDAQRPELGRLWVTTIFLTHNRSYYCNKSEYRDANHTEYLCEVY